jgi:LysR family transcriptional activator of nhaA
VEWLNYHHLLYFWVAAKSGSIVAATKELHLSHPTISGQIHRLEEVLGQKLFLRKGRSLVLTDAGRVAYGYAEEIFALGREFMDTVKGRPSEGTLRLVVGASDSLPKSIVNRMLEPAFKLDKCVRVVYREDRSIDSFLADLASYSIDVLLTNAPAATDLPVRTFSHLLGECGTAFLAAPALAKACRRRFPMSLDKAPILLPSTTSVLRHALDGWFDSIGIRPRVVAELDDSALTREWGETGLGVIPVPDVVVKDILRRWDLRVVGQAADLKQSFYAISVERKIRHPAVLAICETARKNIFA